MILCVLVDRPTVVLDDTIVGHARAPRMGDGPYG